MYHLHPKTPRKLSSGVHLFYLAPSRFSGPHHHVNLNRWLQHYYLSFFCIVSFACNGYLYIVLLSYHPLTHHHHKHTLSLYPRCLLFIFSLLWCFLPSLLLLLLQKYAFLCWNPARHRLQFSATKILITQVQNIKLSVNVDLTDVFNRVIEILVELNCFLWRGLRVSSALIVVRFTMV